MQRKPSEWMVHGNHEEMTAEKKIGLCDTDVVEHAAEVTGITASWEANFSSHGKPERYIGIRRFLCSYR